jgi:flagellar basal body-associated protein FliL
VLDLSKSLIIIIIIIIIIITTAVSIKCIFCELGNNFFYVSFSNEFQSANDYLTSRIK